MKPVPDYLCKESTLIRVLVINRIGAVFSVLAYLLEARQLQGPLQDSFI